MCRRRRRKEFERKNTESNYGAPLHTAKLLALDRSLTGDIEYEKLLPGVVDERNTDYPSEPSIVLASFLFSSGRDFKHGWLTADCPSRGLPETKGHIVPVVKASSTLKHDSQHNSSEQSREETRNTDFAIYPNKPGRYNDEQTRYRRRDL
jgi:hypothetical protein